MNLPQQPEIGAVDTPETHCANCGAPRRGAYCIDCGQQLWEDRLSLATLWREMGRQVFNLERGYLRTVREMFVDPGGVIRRYTAGKRRRYTNPFNYLLICSAISLLLHKFTVLFGGFDFSELMMRTMGDDGPQQLIRISNDLAMWMFDNGAWVSMLISMPFALLLRLFFRRTGVNLAETTVFSLYTLGHVALLGAFFYVPFFVLPASLYDTRALTAFSSICLVAICAWAAVSFFGGRRLVTVLKTWLAMTLAYGLLMSLVMGWLLIKLTNDPSLLEGGEASWTLFRAAEEGTVDKARALLDEGAAIDQVRRQTALHIAAAHGHQALAELLITHGANLEAPDQEGRTPLLVAVFHDRSTTAKVLIAQGAKLEARADDGTTSVMAAAGTTNRTLEALLEAGVDVDARRDHRLATALMIAAEAGKDHRVEALLNHGADPALTNAAGETALDVATSATVRRQLQTALNEPDKSPTAPNP